MGRRRFCDERPSFLRGGGYVAIVGVLLAAGCAPSSTTPTPANDSEQSPSSAEASGPPPVVLPDLSQLEESVQDQIRPKHAALLRMLENSSTDQAELSHAYGELGSILRAAGYFDPAEAAYLNASALDPDNMRWLYFLGHLFRQEGNTATAATYFEQVIALAPENAPALAWLGEMYLDQGRPIEAETLFDQMLELDGGSATAWYGIGRAALARDETARGVEALERALSGEPGASSVHFALGMAYRTLGDVERAEQHLAQGGDLSPLMPDPLMREYDGLLQSTVAIESRGMQEMRAGRFDEAAAVFREGLEVNPDDPQLRHRLGAALMFGGDHLAASAHFEEVLRVTPQYEQAHFSLGLIQSMSGQYDEAMAHYRTAVEYRPNYLEAVLGLAEAQFLTGLLEESLPNWARVIELDPSMEQAWMLRAVTLVQLARYQEARSWLERARRVHPDHVDLTDLLARVLSAAPDDRVRDVEVALALMDERRDGEPTVELQETMAMVMAEAGRFSEAVNWQQEAIDTAKVTRQIARIRFLSRNLAFYGRERPNREPLEPFSSPRYAGQRQIIP